MHFLGPRLRVVDHRLLRINQQVDHPVPNFLSLDDFNLDAQVEDGQILIQQPGHADGILLRCQDPGNPATGASLDEPLQLSFGVPVVVRKTLRQLELHAEARQTLLKAFRRSDGTERPCSHALQRSEGHLFPGGEIMKFHGPMTAFQDRCRAVVLPDPGVQIREITSITLGDQDVGCAAEMIRWFPQGTPGKKMLVAERCLPIDEDKIDPAMEADILESVIQDEDIASQGRDGMTCTFHPVLVDHDGYSPEVLGEHEGLIPRRFGIEQQGTSLGDNAGRGFSPGCPPALHTLVTPAQDSHTPATGRKFTGKFLDDGRFSGSSDGKVSYADDRATHLMAAQQMNSVKMNPCTDDKHVHGGQSQEKCPQYSGPFSGATLQNDINSKLFEAVEKASHRAVGEGYFTIRAPELSPLQIIILDPFGASLRMATATRAAVFWFGAMQQTVDPEPLNQPPSAPAFSPAMITCSRNGTNLPR